MTKIRIKNFGPIIVGCESEDGWIIFKKNTFLIGSQSSGKSTIAKLISICTWLEKSINRGDTNKDRISCEKFIGFAQYHKINNYFRDNTFIDYVGDKFQITFDAIKKSIVISETGNQEYSVPKIMYVPAERNFLSTISDAYNVKGLSDNLFTFAEELKKSQKELKGKVLDLKIGSYKYEYQADDDSSFVLGENHKINLLEASSGLQSYIPLFLVSRNLALSISGEDDGLRKNMSVSQSIRMDNEIAQWMQDKTISDSERNKEIDLIRSRYYNTSFINIIEEPEQNLFPDSQWQVLKSLIEYNNYKQNNKLLITTHSPYLINYLSLMVKAFLLAGKINQPPLKDALNDIVPLKSMIDPDDVIVYQLDETTGSIKKLADYNGLPSDENLLNNNLGMVNDLYINLLEIEDQCQ